MPSGRLGYLTVIEQVVTAGRVRAPRGQTTRDMGFVTLNIESPYNALPVGTGRNINRQIAAAEAIQLAGAFSDPNLLIQASTNFKEYCEDDGEFWGAYGRRIGLQAYHVVEKLTADPDSRQAVIHLWDSHLDNIRGKRDYPCTLNIAFSIRDNMLEMDVTMRSNDVWLGLPYDLFQFSQLQLTIARVLGVEPGRYRHHAYSLHIYEHNVADALRLVRQGMLVETEEHPVGFGVRGETIDTVVARARSIPYLATAEGLNDSESWYWHVLHGYVPKRETLTRS